jgi:hypothetical protein
VQGDDTIPIAEAGALLLPQLCWPGSPIPSVASVAIEHVFQFQE